MNVYVYNILENTPVTRALQPFLTFIEFGRRKSDLAYYKPCHKAVFVLWQYLSHGYDQCQSVVYITPWKITLRNYDLDTRIIYYIVLNGRSSV